MNCGFKYISFTSTALIKLEREFKKIKGITYIASNSVPVKNENLSSLEIKKKIAIEEKDHRNKMSPLKAEFNSFCEDTKN